MMRCAASAMVCSPDEQKRFTVMPAVVTGQPARSAICRAMLKPVAPSGFAQPMSTSSTVPVSMPARAIACCTTWPPSVAPCVRLKAPRQDLVSPVRAVETMTASTTGLAPLHGHVIEGLAFLGQPGDQPGGFPAKLFHASRDTHESDAAGMEHRSAAIHREAVPHEINHVDIRG